MILKAYLKKRLKLLALLCAFALIFALVLWAYRQSGSAVTTALLSVCTYAPVSYTHLDVYKRQLKRRSEK